MQTISTTTHRGRPALRYYIAGKPRYKVLKNPENPQPEMIALAAELLAGPKERKAPKPKPATLDETIEQYKAELLADLDAKRHYYCGQVAYRIRRILDAAGITRIEAITASKVKIALASIRKPCRKPKAKQKPTDPPPNFISDETRRQYTQAIRQFSRWLVRTGRLDHDPTIGVKKRKTRVQPHRRDRFQPAELSRLVAHTRQSQRIIEAISGPDRALLYALAATTGLRKSELGSLTPAAFSLGKQPQLVVESAYTKNGDTATLPLHSSVLPLVREKLAGMAPAELLWPGLAGDRSTGKDAAKFLQADMRDAALPVRTPNGIRCFHSLRNTFISGLFDAGVDVATVRTLARHADPTMTLSYARGRPDGERQAIAKLPALDL
jgi:integrase